MALRRTAISAALTAALLACTGVTAAAAVQDPIPIGPNMPFHGLVNGATVGAVIRVGCFGPILPGQTGHPLSGQTVEADSTPPTSTTGGFTGSAAHSIVVTVQGSPSGSIIVIGTLTSFYAPLKIPTTINLPCGGTTSVVFTPQPTSATARSSVDPVTLLSGP
jgi:hypothetical protein